MVDDRAGFAAIAILQKKLVLLLRGMVSRGDKKGDGEVIGVVDNIFKEIDRDAA